MGAAFLLLRPPRSPWRTLGRTSAALALTLLALLSAAFAVNFPALTGRVVDQANIIPADSRAAIEAKLADLEAKSGIQLVVATVSSLDGQEIEPYANELFRTWKLGEKTKNNGVLLLVAPNERRVRIEVGYGLEGTLTDALSQVIIANAITPRFKAGDYAGGITRGVDDVITVLTTDASEWQQRPSLRLDRAPAPAHINWFAIFGIIIVLGLMIVSPGFRWFILGMLMSGRSSGGGFGGGRSGGGFSGGGGSSGGGGASGRW
ncbi:MAG: TPM domain-containing protein [Reyranella sp.]